MRSFVLIVILIGLLLLNGCGGPQREVKMMNINTQMPSLITYPADIRGTYVVKEDSKLRFCAEPVPDVALESIHKIIGKINLTLPQGQAVGVDVTSDLTAKVIELAGRTQLLLIAREMLYRACELSLNHGDKVEQATGMYNIVVELIRDLGHAEKTQADANLIKRETEFRKVSFGKDEKSKCIEKWMDEKSNNRETLLKWLKENAGGISIAMFLYGKDYSEKRSEFIRIKNIKCD